MEYLLDPELKKNWLAALRSGDYVKGNHRLCTIDSDGDRYCCLGVLYEILHGKDGWNESRFDDLTQSYVRVTALDSSVTFGHSVITDPHVGELAALNDNSDTFDPVIRYIENHL